NVDSSLCTALRGATNVEFASLLASMGAVCMSALAFSAAVLDRCKFGIDMATKAKNTNPPSANNQIRFESRIVVSKLDMRFSFEQRTQQPTYLAENYRSTRKS